MSVQIGEAVTAGISGGIICAAVSGSLNYFVLPLPKSVTENAINHGLTGLFCGVITGFISVMIYMKRQSRAKKP